MGKLYKLRRAIERNPEDWYRVFYDGTISPMGCYFVAGKPHPLYWSNSYRAFVKHVLRYRLKAVGNADNDPGAKK